MVSTLYWYGPRVILASLGARELLLAEAPLLHSSFERLAVAAGVDRPRLYLLPDGHPRAFAVGRGRSSAGVALCRGLVTLSRPAELEGLLAHELAHIRHRDVVVQTPVVVLAGWLLEASRIGGMLERALLVVLAPLAASLVQVSSLTASGNSRPTRPARLLHLAARAGRRARPARAGAGARLVPGQPGDRAPLHGQPLRADRNRGALHDASSGRRTRGAPAKPRSGLAREAARRLTCR